jgi:DnaJ-class molecular chaperone
MRTAAEQHALETLLQLGAKLPYHFTARQLRHEYRRLVHRLHPDRYVAGSDAERERATRLFIDALEHYRVLRDSVDEY